MIEFSKLPKKEKETYMQFLVDNNIEFQQSDQGYIFKVQNKENMDPSRRASMKKSASPILRKLSKEAVLSLIQEIYSQKFEEASLQIKKKQVISEQFNDYAQRIAKERMIDLQASLGFQNEHAALFQKFLLNEYEEEDLMYFLFVRAIVEKEIGSPIYTRSNVIELSTKQLSQKQIQNIILTIFGEQQQDQAEELLRLTSGKKRLSAFEFMQMALDKYCKDKRGPSKIEDLVTEKVFQLLDKFFEEQLQELEMETITKVRLVIKELLASIFKNEKKIWLQKLINPKPEDVIYLEQLTTQSRNLGQSKEEIGLFSRRILQTPQLARTLALIIDN